jgi:hypothetical protein
LERNTLLITNIDTRKERHKSVQVPNKVDTTNKERTSSVHFLIAHIEDLDGTVSVAEEYCTREMSYAGRRKRERESYQRYLASLYPCENNSCAHEQEDTLTRHTTERATHASLPVS